MLAEQNKTFLLAPLSWPDLFHIMLNGPQLGTTLHGPEIIFIWETFCKRLDCVCWAALVVLCLHFICVPCIPFKGLREWECELGGERILRIYTLRAFFTKYLYFYLYWKHTTVSVVKAQCFQWEICKGDVQNQNGKNENEWQFNWLKSTNYQQNKRKGVHMHLTPIKLRMSQH